MLPDVLFICLFVCFFFLQNAKKMPAHLNSPVLLRRQADDKGMGSLLLLVADVLMTSHTARYIGSTWEYENQ